MDEIGEGYTELPICLYNVSINLKLYQNLKVYTTNLSYCMLLPGAWQDFIANELPNPRSTVKGFRNLNELNSRGGVATTDCRMKEKAMFVLH